MTAPPVILRMSAGQVQALSLVEIFRVVDAFQEEKFYLGLRGWLASLAKHVQYCTVAICDPVSLLFPANLCCVV
jgi:hypothetical protein